MDSIQANIFLAVQERLIALVPQLKWVDQELGQLEFTPGERPSVLFPAALIDLPENRYSEQSENIQLAESTLEVRLALDCYTPSAGPHNRLTREKALQYYNIEHLVNKALHGWSDSAYFTPLSRITAQTEKRDDNLRVRILRFSYSFTDFTAMEVTTAVARPPMELQELEPEQ